MTFKHKLSRRLALLKDQPVVVAMAALAVATIIGCEKPVRLTDPVTSSLARVVVSPQVLTLQQNQAADFMAVGFTSSGDTANVAVSWSVSSGSVTDTSTTRGRHYGRYKTGSDTGKVKVVATGNPGGTSDTAVVTVTPAPVASVTLNPTSTTVLVGQTAQLSATTTDSVGNVLSGRTVTWVSSNASVAAVSAVGLVTGVGLGSATITATSEGQSNTASVTVTNVPVASVSVTPASATLQVGQTVQLTATPRDSNGNALSGRVVTWSSSTPSVATVSGGGLVTGVAAGSSTITAASEGKSGTASVAVTAAPTLVRIILSPDTATVYVGKTKQFSVSGKYSDSSVAPVSATFTATGGTITATGLYTAGQTTGTFRVMATSTTTALTDTSAVTIQLAPLAQLILVPALATVPVGGSAQFQVYGRTTAGDSVAAQATYSATGGVVSSAGFYTAGSTPGTFQVVARQTNGTLADTAAVTIAPATSCVSTATMLCPGDDIQAKATAAGPGATLTLQPGIYRLQTVTPLSGQHFVGQAGAIMSGAKLLTGWTQSGGTWYVSGQAQNFGPDGGMCASGTACQYPEDVYRDNARLTRVLSLAAVTTGTFFFDYTADRIYVGDDPAGHVLEGAATQYAFYQSGQTGVTIQGLIVEKYANPAGSGAVGRTALGDNWVLSGSVVRYNHGGGVKIGYPHPCQVLNNYIHHNGQVGIVGSGATGTLIQGNEIAYNNTAGYNPAWEAGGIKFTGQNGVTFTGAQARNNFVHHNHGLGIWFDTNYDGVLVDANTVEDNELEGIEYEISYSATITNNIINRNGASSPSNYEGAGILVYSSGGSGIEISGNTLAGNKNGIMLIQASRGSGTLGTYITQNANVHDNTVTLTAGQRHGAHLYGGASGTFTTLNNHFTHNTYNLQATGTTPFAWSSDGTNNADIGDAAWRAVPNDVTGTFNR